MGMAGGLALALSGGGARGAFQVGVLDELIRVRKVEFETAAGTSTGAIQAAGVVQNDIARLHDFWSELSGNSSIFRPRGGTIWPIITGKNSLYNPAPLKRLLHEMIDEDSVRISRKNLRISAVNLATSELRILTEKDRNTADWIYASSAQPPFFPPFETRDVTGRIEQWVDGGVRDVIPLKAALVERPRAVLVVRAEAPLPPSNRRFDNLVEIGLQSIELQTREVGNSDIGNADLMNRMLAAEAAQRRELEKLGLSPGAIEGVMRPFSDEIERAHFAPLMVIEPETELYDRLEFDPALIARNIDRGRQAVCDQWSALAPFLGVAE